MVDTGEPPQLDPLPFQAGEPDGPEYWAESGLPPMPLRFLHARATVGGWLLPCPRCAQGWAFIIPDLSSADEYRIASEISCTRGCPKEEIDDWHAWRCGGLVASPSGKNVAYAQAALRRIFNDLREGEDPVKAVRQARRFVRVSGLDPVAIAHFMATLGETPIHPAEAHRLLTVYSEV